MSTHDPTLSKICIRWLTGLAWSTKQRNRTIGPIGLEPYPCERVGQPSVIFCASPSWLFDVNILHESFIVDNKLCVSSPVGFKLRAGVGLGGTITVYVARVARFHSFAQGDYRQALESRAVRLEWSIPAGILGDFLGRKYSYPPSI